MFQRIALTLVAILFALILVFAVRGGGSTRSVTIEPTPVSVIPVGALIDYLPTSGTPLHRTPYRTPSQ